MRRGTFATLLAALLLSGTLLGSAHHHDDLKSHADCLVCTLQGQLFAADVPAGSDATGAVRPATPPEFRTTVDPLSVKSPTLFARAPPFPFQHPYR